MKAFILAAAVAAIAAGGLATSGAEAGSLKKPLPHRHHFVTHKGKVTPGERFAIRHSHSKLARVKAKVFADGKVSPREKIQLKRAQHRHAKTVHKAVR